MLHHKSLLNLHFLLIALSFHLSLDHYIISNIFHLMLLLHSYIHLFLIVILQILYCCLLLSSLIHHYLHLKPSNLDLLSLILRLLPWLFLVRLHCYYLKLALYVYLLRYHLFFLNIQMCNLLSLQDICILYKQLGHIRLHCLKSLLSHHFLHLSLNNPLV